MIFGAIFPMVWNKVSILIKREHLFSFIGIQLIAFLSMITHYIALKYLPIVKDSLLFNLLPIFFTIFGVMLLHEKVQRNEVVWMIGAFVGVIVMISNKTDSDMNSSFTMQLVSSIMVIFSWATCALICLYIRIFNQTNSPLLYPFYYAVTLSAFGIGFYFIYPSSYNPDWYSFNVVWLFLVSGIFNIVANILSGYALKLAEISILAPFGYIRFRICQINFKY